MGITKSGGERMNEKTNLLANMERGQLIKIVGAEQARLTARGIEIDSSTDDDTIRSYLTTLNLRTIRKHARKLGITITEERIVEETVTRREISRSVTSVAEEVETEVELDAEVKPPMSKESLLIELVKLEGQGLTKDHVIQWAKDKRLSVTDTPTLITTLEQFDENFLTEVYQTFITSKTGKGLEVRFAQWLKNHSSLIFRGQHIFGKDPIKLRHRLTGRSGVTHEVDIYAQLPSKEEGRVIKQTIHPGALFLISCKSTKGKVTKAHVAEWRAIVRDILLADQNQIEGVEMVGIVSMQGFTPDAIRFSRWNPIITFRLYDKDLGTYHPDVNTPLLLFEQKSPTQFVQISPEDTEDEITHFLDNLGVDLENPYDIKSPKDWDFDWLLPNMWVIDEYK